MRCVDLVKDPQGQLLLRAFGGLRRLLFSLFHRRATWSVGRPGAAFSTPMSVALQWRLPRRRPPCPCCKFTSSTAIPRLFSSTACPLVLGSPHITEFLHDFHHQATTSCTTHELSLFWHMFTSATGYIFSFGLSRRRHEPPFKPGGSVGALVGRPGFRAGFARIRARGRGRGRQRPAQLRPDQHSQQSAQLSPARLSSRQPSSSAQLRA